MTEYSNEPIVLFHPHIPSNAVEYVNDTLHSRWIGQGPKVNLFEERFARRFTFPHSATSVGSGTDALHLAYLCAGLQPGDEVITPVFTCVATNMPLLYQGVTIRFADIQQSTLNIDPAHAESLVNERTKAIVCVHYGGLPCDLAELQQTARSWNIPIIEDAAHAVGAVYRGASVGAISEFTAFSFQGIKHITTGDGGMLALREGSLLEKARRMRWFGIDRMASTKGVWENDITEVGYKYQMTDISAAMGLAALDEFDETLRLRRELFVVYEQRLANIPGIRMLGTGFTDREHAAWLCTVIVERREDLQRKLQEHRIESDQVHYRNDRYSVFGGRCHDLPAMDAIEDNYLVLPLHTKMTAVHVERICDVIGSGW